MPDRWFGFVLLLMVATFAVVALTVTLAQARTERKRAERLARVMHHRLAERLPRYER